MAQPSGNGQAQGKFDKRRRQFSHPSSSIWGDSRDPDDQADGPAKVLSADEARALVGRYRKLTPGRVLFAQVVAGAVTTAMFGALVHQPSALWSALYGSAIVVVPGALMAFALHRRKAGSVAASQFGLLMWAVLKLMLGGAMLAAAPRVVHEPHWPALLIALVVCLKVNALALLWQGRIKKTELSES